MDCRFDLPSPSLFIRQPGGWWERCWLHSSLDRGPSWLRSLSGLLSPAWNGRTSTQHLKWHWLCSRPQCAGYTKHGRKSHRRWPLHSSKMCYIQVHAFERIWAAAFLCTYVRNHCIQNLCLMFLTHVHTYVYTHMRTYTMPLISMHTRVLLMLAACLLSLQAMLLLTNFKQLVNPRNSFSALKEQIRKWDLMAFAQDNKPMTMHSQSVVTCSRLVDTYMDWSIVCTDYTAFFVRIFKRIIVQAILGYPPYCCTYVRLLLTYTHRLSRFIHSLYLVWHET